MNQEDGYSPHSSWKQTPRIKDSHSNTCHINVTIYTYIDPFAHPNHKKGPFADYHHISLPTQSHCWLLTLILLTWRKWWAPNNASKQQMGFKSAFKGLKKLFSCSLLTSVNLLSLATSSHWVIIALHLKQDNSYKHFWESEWGIMPGKLKILYMSLPK